MNLDELRSIWSYLIDLSILILVYVYIEVIFKNINYSQRQNAQSLEFTSWQYLSRCRLHAKKVKPKKVKDKSYEHTQKVKVKESVDDMYHGINYMPKKLNSKLVKVKPKRLRKSMSELVSTIWMKESTIGFQGENGFWNIFWYISQHRE